LFLAGAEGGGEGKDVNRWKNIIKSTRVSASGGGSRRTSLQLPAPPQ
jgi:hypothetical protein